MIASYDWIRYAENHPKSDFTAQIKSVIQDRKTCELSYGDTHKLLFDGSSQCVVIMSAPDSPLRYKIIPLRMTYTCLSKMLNGDWGNITGEEIQYLEDAELERVLRTTINSVYVRNNPFIGYQYEAKVHRSGLIEYKNNVGDGNEAILFLKASDANYIVDLLIAEWFDEPESEGEAMIDGYHWQIEFNNDMGLIKTIEGWPCEDLKRYRKLKTILEFMEGYIPKQFGTEFMTFYEEP